MHARGSRSPRRDPRTRASGRPSAPADHRACPPARLGRLFAQNQRAATSAGRRPRPASTRAPATASATRARTKRILVMSYRPGSGQKSSPWLLVRGRGDAPLPAEIGPERLQRHGSSRRPSVAKGDLAICYASVWQAIFAVVEIASEPEHDPSRNRWAWSFAIRPLAFVADLHDAPAVEEAGIFPQSLWRHSYIRLTAEQFEAARELICRIA